MDYNLRIQNNTPDLEQTLTNLPLLLINMLAEYLISTEQKQVIECEAGNIRQSRKLLGYVGENCGTRNTSYFEAFLGILHRTGNYDAISILEANQPTTSVNEPCQSQSFFQWNLPSKNEMFTGRKEVLKEILTHLLKKKHFAVITTCLGLGGVGKTSVALEYAWTTPWSFTGGIYWFDAENPNRLLEQFISLGFHLKFLLWRHEDPLTQKLKVVDWFQENNGWLIVFDNASSLIDIASFLPNKGGQILITSRHTSDWPSPGTSIELDTFEPEEATEFVAKFLGSANRFPEAELNSLCERFGYLPLAIVQASAYIKKTGISIVDYLVLVETKKKNLLETKVLQPSRDARTTSVYITWDITMDVVRSECPLAESYLEIIAFLDSDDIPHELAKNLSSWYADNVLYSDIVGTLNSYSMIRSNGIKQNCSVHRLVQEVTRLKCSQTKLTEVLVSTFLLLNMDYSILFHSTSTTLKLQLRLKPHLEMLRARLVENIISDKLVVRFSKMASPYSTHTVKLSVKFMLDRITIMTDLSQFDPDSRINQLLKLKKKFRKFYGRQSMTVANCLRDVGESYTASNSASFYIGCHYLKKAVAIYQKPSHTTRSTKDSIRILADSKFQLGQSYFNSNLDRYKGLVIMHTAINEYQQIDHYNAIQVQCLGKYVADEYEIFRNPSDPTLLLQPYQRGWGRWNRSIEQVYLSLMRVIVQRQGHMSRESKLNVIFQDQAIVRQALSLCLTNFIIKEETFAGLLADMTRIIFKNAYAEVQEYLNQPDEVGQTLLKTACNVQSSKCISLLLAAGADVCFIDNAGDTALHCVVGKPLQSDNLSASAKCPKSGCALDLILNQLQKQFSEDLSSLTRFLNLQNNMGFSPLMVAAKVNEYTHVEKLIKINEVDVNMQNLQGESALNIAVKEQKGLDKLHTVRTLILNREDIDLSCLSEGDKEKLVKRILGGEGHGTETDNAIILRKLGH